MPYTHETRTFTVEIEVTATATIETGGGYSDEPPWANFDGVAINRIDVNGLTVMNYDTMSKALIDAAKEEFCE